MLKLQSYTEKYGPMLKLLDSERDFDFLSSQEGYGREIGIKYREIRRLSLRDYLSELQADFAELYQAAAPIAVSNADLAKCLVSGNNALSRASRAIRFRLWVEAIMPSPAPTLKQTGRYGPITLVRKTLSWVTRQRRAPLELLLAMNSIREVVVHSRF